MPAQCTESRGAESPASQKGKGKLRNRAAEKCPRWPRGHPAWGLGFQPMQATADLLSITPQQHCPNPTLSHPWDLHHAITHGFAVGVGKGPAPQPAELSKTTRLLHALNSAISPQETSAEVHASLGRKFRSIQTTLS